MDETTPVTPSRISWGPVAALVVAIGSYFISQFLASLIVTIYPALKHWNALQITDWLNSSVIAQFLFVLIAEGFILVLLGLFLKRKKANFKAVGFANRKPQLRDVALAVGGFIAYIMLYIFAITLLKQIFPSLNVAQKQQTGFEHAAGGYQLILVFMSLVILPPLVEEIVTRGFLYQGLKKGMPKIWAVILTSILFASAHLQFGSGAPLLWVAAVDTFTLSLVLIYLFERTGSLWASITLHMLKNTIAFLALFVFKG
ncbi:MAG: hypothetical protein JWS12_160 [Candidatus Saccharibacteria bacterium]|nr:hypothetical protein [Candidatus Saccharibacteria bacterium]